MGVAKPSVPALYKIGLLADTHNHWNPRIGELFAGVDEIWHLGDVCEETIVDELRAISQRVIVVLGNNDFTLDYPVSRNLERGGEKFHLVHIPPRAWPVGTNWIVFGHTHRPCNEVEEGVRWFNPGTVSKPNHGAAPSVGMLVSREGKPFVGEIIPL
jgi:uncharacterized protein